MQYTTDLGAWLRTTVRLLLQQSIKRPIERIIKHDRSNDSKRFLTLPSNYRNCSKRFNLQFTYDTHKKNPSRTTFRMSMSGPERLD